jgi:hypothetical protein
MATRPPSEKPLRADEGLTPASGRALSNADSLILPTHAQHSDLENVEPESDNPLTSIPKAAWKRFNGYGRKHVGFFDSVTAIVFSSCAFTSIVFGCGRYSRQIPQT